MLMTESLLVAVMLIQSTRLGVGAELELLPGRQFRVADPEAEVLAVRNEPNETAVMAWKRVGTWLPVYTAVAPLLPPVLRGLAAIAGVYLYTDSPDYLVFAGRHYLTLGAPLSDGRCEVALPGPRTVSDPFIETTICRQATKFHMEPKPKEVRILHLE